MYFYNVLPTKNMGQNLSILLYSSQKQASVGDIVEITIRNNVDFGLILSENIEEGIKWQNSNDQVFSNQFSQDGKQILENCVIDNRITKSEVLSKKFEIKEINKILPIKLSQKQIQFVKIFADNTFNSLNDTWDAIIQPYSLLTQKQWKELEEMAELRENAESDEIRNNIVIVNTSSNKIQNVQNDSFIKAKIFDKTGNNVDNIELSTNNSNQEQKPPKVDFLIDFDVIVRIMYIIRSLTSIIREEQKALKQGINRQLLIVFPEKKYLNKVYKSIFNEISRAKELSQIVELLYYASEPTKKPKECVWSMINFGKEDLKNIKLKIENENTKVSNPQNNIQADGDEIILDKILNQSQNDNLINNSNQTSQNVNLENQTPRLQIILSTRSGLFLPFTTLTDIILVDEGNSMYIQDQNSLYYDTREAIFLISKALNANISFISPLPSIRLYNMYNKEALEQQMTNYTNIIQKPRKIKITRFDKKSSKYDLFGYEIEQILREFDRTLK